MENLKELLDQKRYTQFKQEIAGHNDADIAAFLDELPKIELVKTFRLLPKDIAADVFAYLPIESAQYIITSLTDREAGEIIDNLYSDDAADLLEEMPAGIVKRLLANTDPETRRDVNHLLQYPEDSAGSIMTVEFVDLKAGLTVGQAIGKIKEEGIDKETIDICFVLDPQRRLIGAISLRKLILSNENEIIGNIMEENVKKVTTTADQEEVSHIFRKYDFTSMPVVDSENRLVGIITVDDIVDIMQQEATEDIEMMAAIRPSDKPYIKTGVIEIWRSRIPWLLILMISATFTSNIINRYQGTLTSMAVLSIFIPMFMNTGGNAGSQASVTIIRGIALGEIKFRDIFYIIWKETRVAVLCGVTLSVINFAKLMLFDARFNPEVTVMVAFTVSCTLMVTVFSSKIVGCTLPMFAKKLGFDPALMASQFITTIVDALSLLIYFRVAAALLHI